MNKNSKIARAKQNRLVITSNCAICCKERSTYINQEPSGLLSNLVIWTRLSGIPIFWNLFF